MKMSESYYKLTQDMHNIGDIRTSNTKLNKTPNNMTITSGNLKRLTISGLKMNIKFHGSLNSPMISKRSTIKKILNILFLRQIEALKCRGNCNPKKETKRTKIRRKKLLTKMGLDKGDILRIISSNDHIIDIKEKSPTTW